MNRAYSALHVKDISEDGSVVRIKGIASTPTVDRMGDIVNPLGARFKTPMPLLWQHQHDKPVGHVVFAKPNKSGIPFEAEIPVIKEPGTLKDRVDEAIQSLRHKLVAFTSIGFSAVPDATKRLAGGGLEFSEWNWHELSLVTIPAQPDAVITSVKSLGDGETPQQLSLEQVIQIKSLDRQQRAASGNAQLPVVRLDTPAGASATVLTKTFISPKPQEGSMNIQEQMKGFQDALNQKAARMHELMEKSAAENVTLDAEQSEEYETLEGEIKSIQAHLKRLESLELLNIQKAKPVTNEPTQHQAQSMEFKQFNAVAKPAPLRDGLAMAQVVKFLGRAKGSEYGAFEMAKSTQGTDPRVVAVLKAAVAAGSTTNATNAGALVGEETSVYADFLEFLRPQTIIGRFGTNGIPALRPVPFRTALIGQTSGGAGYWVGEGQAKPLTNFDFSRTTLEPLKVANIAVVTEEVLRDSSPAADGIIRDQLVAALRERLDIDFISPSKAAVAGISPASITNGVTPIVSSGNDAEAVRADMRRLFGAFIAANNAPTAGVWVMSATTALALSLMQNPLGQAEFPGITMMGGTLFGLPALISEYVPVTADGGTVALVNASDIYVGDEGGFAVDMSREASLQMDNAPTMNITTPTGTQLVSLWQTNSVGFRAERTINWARRRQSAVALLTNVNWGVEAAAAAGA
ncbi:phage prohead protease, HK97 family/phage major capsid protein, HK97 family,TIGR01554 [Pseudomonas luteola]|uniref:Phage major capsid protein n=2 Tax=Pseudomonas TaxID=286 RepID=A0ABS0FPP6_PSELU|nr:phage major capsid protein [Pseudomonas zeshuii]RRW48349.1 phage major capsid protein [Pseudomonas luteola]SHJ24523.1 phage prohead protease, HK97 family/phage major capsid protein, HK97 family,TIGR01554 [Pseudomonas zeshuii]